MQINLVFSPFAMPCAPLGIAGIKSYVEKNSDFHVKCLDWNVIYQNALDDDIRNNKGNIKMSEHDRSTFLEAVDVFKAGNEDFFNQAVYDRSVVTVFVDCFKMLNGFFSKECRKALYENKHIPWFVQECVEFLLLNKADVVGFSIMFPEQIFFSLLAARMLKTADRNIKIVFGGHSSSAAYKDILTQQFIDFVVLNEGEKAFLDLLSALNGDKELGQVPNLAFNSDGKVTVTESSLITNLDDTPFPDFSDFDLSRYFAPEPVLPILGSRGCYWRRCAFCVHYKSYLNKYRTASVKRVVDELQYHVDNGVKYFDFVDEMIPSARFKQIGEEIVRRGLQVYYYGLAKPTSDFTNDVLDVMYESGCRYIIWGVESGCQRILDLMDKGTNVKDISRVLEDSALAGIKNHVYVMVAFPSETKEELWETLEFLYENRDNIHVIHKGRFNLHKGSLVYENPEKFYITKMYAPDFSCGGEVKYDVSQGIKQDDAELYRVFYTKNYFHCFNYFSDCLSILRHHALLLYSNHDKLTFNLARKAVPLPVEIGLPPQLSSAGY